MKLNLFSKLVFATLLAFLVNSFVYFSFGNIYSSKILNYPDFQDQFQSGIYQYRKLSGYFLIGIYDFLSLLNIDYQIFKLKFFNPESDPKMYLSFYILNTFFLMLTTVLMVFITEMKSFIANSSEKILLIAISIFTIGISQFVLVPYDVSSYFFILVFFWFLLKYLEQTSVKNLIIMVAILGISTFNRESSALSISLAATLLYAKCGIKKESIVPLGILTATFIGVYISMRLLSNIFTTNDGNLLVENFTQPKNWLGILFWIVFFMFTMLLAKSNAAKRNIIMFHIVSLPYLLMCFYTGILYEMRLYVPLFVTSILLAKTNHNIDIQNN